MFWRGRGYLLKNQICVPFKALLVEASTNCCYRWLCPLIIAYKQLDIWSALVSREMVSPALLITLLNHKYMCYCFTLCVFPNHRFATSWGQMASSQLIQPGWFFFLIFLIKIPLLNAQLYCDNLGVLITSYIIDPKVSGNVILDCCFISHPSRTINECS